MKEQLFKKAYEARKNLLNIGNSFKNSSEAAITLSDIYESNLNEYKAFKLVIEKMGLAMEYSRYEWEKESAEDKKSAL